MDELLQKSAEICIRWLKWLLARSQGKDNEELFGPQGTADELEWAEVTEEQLLDDYGEEVAYTKYLSQEIYQQIIGSK